VICVEAHCQVVLGDDGRPIGMRGVTLDISDRKQLEREREELLQRERSARADADAANRLKDDFLATLSHELRTPPNAILGYVRLLGGGVFDDARREKALEVVERNAATLTQMVEDVLDVSRIVVGKIRLNVEDVDIRRVIEEAVASARPAADARGVALQMMLDSHVAHVTGDAERLQQVIWNLLSNGVKFTPRGGTMQVRLTSLDSFAEIVVTDSGVGISPEFLPHVFERFRQADSRFAREHGGLGLAIAREIVHLHGGSIEAASDGEGKGATFTVTLPLIRAAGSGIRDPALREPQGR
jgi:signal transduction histidine kinase